jgi:hypothetical protein
VWRSHGPNPYNILYFGKLVLYPPLPLFHDSSVPPPQSHRAHPAWTGIPTRGDASKSAGGPISVSIVRRNRLQNQLRLL